MQKTALDRWLQKKYVQVYKVYCNTLPPQLPSGVVAEDAGEENAGRYRYCFTVNTDAKMSELAATLEVANVTYTSRIAEQDGLANKLFNNPEKSFTLQVAWMILLFVISMLIFSGLPEMLWSYLSAEEEEEDGSKPTSALVEPVGRFV
jgi:hypothetical protein